MSETELKFEVTQADLKRLAQHPAFAGKAERQSLRSAYYDTPADDLREADLTLRVRRKDGAFIQTVKRTRHDDLFDRDEWEAPTKGKSPDPILVADTPVAEVIERYAGDLEERFVTNIRREARLYRNGHGLIEISIDRGDIAAGEAREPIHELEIELKDGEPQALYALAEALAEAAPIRLAFDSKSERGYRLAAGKLAAPRKTDVLPLTPETPAAEAFARAARACLIQLAGNAQALRRERNPDTLHQARIGIRRLRSALTVFKSLAQDDGFSWLREETRWLAGELNLARDLDVFAERLRGDVEAEPDLAPLVKHLEQARERAYDAVMLAIDAPRFSKLLLKTALWIEDGAWRRDAEREAERAEPIKDFAARRLEGWSRSLRKKGRGLKDCPPELRHRLRIRAKKLRYATEFFAGAFEVSAKRRRTYNAAVRGLQDALGELNDVAVAERTARQGLAGRRSADLAFAAGKWVGELRGHEPQLVAAAVQAYRAFKDARPFWRG